MIDELLNYQVIVKSSSDSLENYVNLVNVNNIKSISFLIKAPTSDIEYPTENTISVEEFESIINKIDLLRKSYPNIKINIGVISDYNKSKEKYLGELRNKVDFVSLKIKPTGVVEYFKKIREAIESGIYDNIIGIEDLFNYRGNLTVEERKKFDSQANDAFQIIAEKLNELGIPINLDINSIPHSMQEFLRVTSFYHNKIIKSCNLTNSNELPFGKNSLSLLNLNNVVNNDNPRLERLTNQKLSYIFNNRQAKIYSIYTERCLDLLRNILNKTPKETDKSLVEYYIMSSLDNAIKVDNDKANYMDQGEFNKIESFSLSQLTAEEKTIELERVKRNINNINNTLSKRISLINMIKESVKYAFQVGASTPDDILTITTYLIEIKVGNNESMKKVLVDNLMNLEESLKSSSGKEDNAILSKRNPAFQNNESKQSFNWNSGIINLMSISLILTFILGFGIGIAYMLLKIS